MIINKSTFISESVGDLYFEVLYKTNSVLILSLDETTLNWLFMEELVCDNLSSIYINEWDLHKFSKYKHI